MIHEHDVYGFGVRWHHKFIARFVDETNFYAVNTNEYVEDTILGLYTDEIPRVQVVNLNIWANWPRPSIVVFQPISGQMIRTTITHTFKRNSVSWVERLETLWKKLFI